jgi:hypothetical protein
MRRQGRVEQVMVLNCQETLGEQGIVEAVRAYWALTGKPCDEVELGYDDEGKVYIKRLKEERC